MSREAVLPPALWHLLGLQWQSQARSAWRGLQTGRGQLYGAIMIGLAGLFLYAVLSRDAESSQPLASDMRVYAALGLFLFWVLWLPAVARGGGLRFDRAETDQLFPSPFHRRELLLYHIIQSTLGTALLSLVALWVVLPVGGTAVAVLLGVFLGLSMFSLSFMLVGMLATCAAFALSRRARTALTVGAVSAVGLGLYLMWSSATSIDGALQGLSTLGPVQVLLFPFRMIVETVLAERVLPDLLLWGGGLLCVDALLVFAIVALDADFMERSLAAGERDFARLKQLRRQQSAFIIVGKVRGRWRPPSPPYLAGAGPIAWRQAVLAVRSELFWNAVAMVSTVSIGFIVLARTGVMPSAIVPGMVAVALVLLFPAMLQSDFRSDLGRLDVLKSLPVGASAVVAGQLAVPVAVGVALWWVFAILLVMMGMIPPRLFWLVCALALPVNVYLFAVENLFCLAFPFTITRGGVGQLHQQGRAAMVAIGKMLVGLLGVMLTAAIGGALWWFTGAPMLAVIVGAVVGMSLVAGLAVAGCEWAYERLEPTQSE
jgi:hypothetical protein